MNDSSINGFADNHMDSCIEFIVVNSDSEDNEQLYTIDLTAEEQIAVYNRLDEQCRKYLDKGCEELLAEAQKRMEEDIEYEKTHPIRFAPEEEDTE